MSTIVHIQNGRQRSKGPVGYCGYAEDPNYIADYEDGVLVLARDTKNSIALRETTGTEICMDCRGGDSLL